MGESAAARPLKDAQGQSTNLAHHLQHVLESGHQQEVRGDDIQKGQSAQTQKVFERGYSGSATHSNKPAALSRRIIHDAGKSSRSEE